jgi:YD repeat-containing protein
MAAQCLTVSTWLIFFLLSPVSAATIAYTYDQDGRLTKVDYAEQGSIEYSYDNNGNILKSQVSSTGGEGGGSGSAGPCFVSSPNEAPNNNDPGAHKNLYATLMG